MKKMLHKDRFFATINYEQPDRPASWLGLPVPSAEPGLLNYFKANSVNDIKEIIDDDIYPIEVPYNYPPSYHIACAFDFAKKNILTDPMTEHSLLPDFLKTSPTLMT